MAGEGVEGGVRELAGGYGGCGVAEEAAAVHGHFYHRLGSFDGVSDEARERISELFSSHFDEFREGCARWLMQRKRVF